MGKPLVSIIILNYNGKRFLNECLSTVFGTIYPEFEVILVDNASTDKSLDFVSKVFADKKCLKIIRNRKNLGFGPANNVGVKHAKGDYIVFLNNDTSVEPEWLATLVDAFENDSTIGLAQSLILSMDGKTVQSAGYLIGDYWIFQFAVGGNYKWSKDMLPDVFDISFASGAAMAVKRKFLQEIGLFDPKYFWYYDDTYLSFRTWLANKRVVTVSGSKIRHLGEGTSKREINNALDHYWIITRISLIFDVYWNLLDLLEGLFIYSLGRISYSLKEIIKQRNLAYFRTNLSGARWIMENFRYIWENRLKYWSKAVIDEKALRSRMIKIKIPNSAYFAPKLGDLYFKIETDKYITNRLLLHQR